MELTLPGADVTWELEWLVCPGVRLGEGDVVAWLSRATECALVPLRAPCAGVLTERWSDAVPSGPAGAVVAVIDGPPGECQAAERRALEPHLAAAQARLSSLGGGWHPAAGTLLQAERTSLEGLVRALTVRLSELEGRANEPPDPVAATSRRRQ